MPKPTQCGLHPDAEPPGEGGCNYGTAFLRWCSDRDGERYRFDGAWEKFAGAPVRGHSDWERGVHPDDQPGLAQGFARALLLRVPHQAEYRFRRADGQYRWLLEQAQPLHAADGSFRGHAAICLDVTQRRLAEQSLRESEQRFRRSFENPLAGMIIADPDKTFIDVNDTLCQMLGYAREELVGRTWADFTHPDDISGNVDLLADVVAGRSDGYLLEKRYRRKDGRTVYAIISARAVRDEEGRLQYLMTMVQDVTAARDNERIMQAIVRSTSAMTGEAFFRSLVRNLAQALSVRIAFVGKLSEVRPGFVDTVCVWADGAYVPNLSYLLAGTPCAQLIARGQVTTFPDRLIERFPDDPLLAEWGVSCYAGAPLFDASGRALGVIGVLDEKALADADKAEQLLQVLAMRAGAELERASAQEQLVAAKAEAERANNAKSRFLAAASHDLRQPLSALALYLDVLKNTAPPGQQGLVRSMNDCVGSLSGLLTDLLDLSKLDAGVVKPNPADFPIADMLAGLVSMCAPEARVKGLRLRCVPSRLAARTDPVLFQRMLANLLSNALRYTERGGVLVGCRRRQGRTWVEVWDTGIGIPEDKTGEIFEEFHQLGDPGRNRGSGLGLAIVAKSAALLGLALRVKSRPGLGSMFALEMPPGTLVEAPADRPAEPRALRIALVEDNVHVRNALALALSCKGHEVVAAESGADIHARLDGQAPDIVVSDYRLATAESGFDVIASLRTAFGERLPAILITGDTDPGLLRSMAERGITVLHKPLDMAALAACMTAQAHAPGADRRNALS